MEITMQVRQVQVGARTVGLFVPVEEELRRAYEEGRIAFPYWARIWPSAIALSEFVASHPEYVSGKSILELGAGLGLPSIVSAAWARFVVCSDKEPAAIAAIARSARHHRLQNFQARRMDWNDDTMAMDAEVVLLSDINYDPGVFQRLILLIQRFLAAKATILLATPQRLMAREFMKGITAEAVLHKISFPAENGPPISIFVLRH